MFWRWPEFNGWVVPLYDLRMHRGLKMPEEEIMYPLIPPDGCCFSSYWLREPEMGQRMPESQVIQDDYLAICLPVNNFSEG